MTVAMSYRPIDLKSERDFLDNSLLMIAIFQDDRIKYANKKVLEILGYNHEEITKKGFWKNIIHPDELPNAIKMVQDLIESENYKSARYRRRIIGKSGKVIHVDGFNKNCYYNGRIAMYITLFPNPLYKTEVSSDNIGFFLHFSEEEVESILESLQVDRLLNKKLIEKFVKYAWRCKYKKVIQKDFR